MEKKKGLKQGRAGRFRPPKKKLSPDQEKAVARRVEPLAAALCNDESIELVHVEFVNEFQQYFLRVYIDKPGGVTMEDCTLISRQLGDILDVNLNLDTEYRLEVSSPGIYRPLFKKGDYLRFKGNTVEIRTVTKVMDKKKFTGILEGITDDDRVMLSIDGNTVAIDYSSIQRARIAETNGENRC